MPGLTIMWRWRQAGFGCCTHFETADHAGAVQPRMVAPELLDHVDLLDVEVRHVHQLAEEVVVAQRRVQLRTAGRASGRRIRRSVRGYGGLSGP